LLTASFVIERRAAVPPVDLRLLTSRTSASANLVSLIVAAPCIRWSSVGWLLSGRRSGFQHSVQRRVAAMSLLVMATAGGLAPNPAGGVRDLARRPA
jgi:hypothetical protein